MITRNQVLRWLPCSDFPTARIDAIFAARKNMSVRDVWNEKLEPDDFLWVTLRESVMGRAGLSEFMGMCLNHASREIGPDESTHDTEEAFDRAASASVGQIKGLPASTQADRWMRGATGPEQAAGVCALWCTVAVARSVGADKSQRSEAWDVERYWQARVALRLAERMENVESTDD